MTRPSSLDGWTCGMSWILLISKWVDIDYWPVWCNLSLVTHGPHTSHALISCNLGGVGMKAMSSFVFLWLPKFPSLSLSNVTNSMDLLSIILLTTLYNDVANSHSTCTVDAGPIERPRIRHMDRDFTRLRHVGLLRVTCWIGWHPNGIINQWVEVSFILVWRH